MIRIRKKKSHRPSIKYANNPNKGKDKLDYHSEELIKTFNSDVANYSSGQSKLSFKPSIYGDQAIRKKLASLQHGKCCYCEKKLDTADVEHFRPKSSYRSDRNDIKRYPGYYSLAYSWENLLLACRGCNLNKSDIFPIEHKQNRFVHHYEDYKREMPLVINPTINRPKRYLKFSGATIIPKNKRLLGTNTISVLRLNRPALEEARRDHINMIKYTKIVANLPPSAGVPQQDIDEAKKDLERYKGVKSRFSAMTTDYLNK